jgi:hypothetical protein
MQQVLMQRRIASDYIDWAKNSLVDHLAEFVEFLYPRLTRKPYLVCPFIARVLEQ